MADVLAKLRDRRLQRVQATLPSSRSCEGCDTCCTAVGVHEINKPAGVACSHLQGEPGRSCSLYPRHPLSCREFFCLWRASDHILPTKARPADVGWVASFNDIHRFPLVVTIHPDPARPDAWNNPKDWGLFGALADAWNCLVAVGQGALAQRVFAPGWVTFSRDEAPEFFLADQIGCPDELFGPDRRPPIERIRENSHFQFRNY